MKVNGKNYRTIWMHPNDKNIVQIIDQQKLPFEFKIKDLKTKEDAYKAIKDMTVRGAPLIGATGAAGLYLTSLSLSNELTAMKEILGAGEYLKSSRPTAINLANAIDAVLDEIHSGLNIKEIQDLTYKLALERIDLELNYCRSIGKNGVKLIEEIHKKKKGDVVNILTHCNAGWLACIDYGTATAPIYFAHEKGIKVHVWVDETRPRNQGSKLTAWELSKHGIPNTIISDNLGGHLMQHKMVDIVIVGSDRTTRTGDVANKIGTYLKALAASDNNVPFYVALPSSTFDFSITDGLKQIPIEQRDSGELYLMDGLLDNNTVTIDTRPVEEAEYANYGFDVTPARLINGLITERGICDANEQSITNMFSDLLLN